MLLFFLNRQEYVSELFHYLHSSTDSPQLLALLESFLFSVVRDVKHYASENQRLEEALKRFVTRVCYPLFTFPYLDNYYLQQSPVITSVIMRYCISSGCGRTTQLPVSRLEYNLPDNRRSLTFLHFRLDFLAIKCHLFCIV